MNLFIRKPTNTWLIWAKWLQQNWFLGLLAVLLLIGSTAHTWFSPLVAQKWLQNSLVFTVMFLMALPLPWQMIHAALKRPWPALLGSTINLAALPIMAAAVSGVLPSELANGVIVAAAVPSTIASAAVWTRRAGGDETIAILVTLITNGLCVLVTPFWISTLMQTTIQVDAWDLVKTLMFLILVPILLAQILRLSSPVRQYAQAARTQLSVLCQLGILSMVFIGAVQMGQRLPQQDAHAAVFFFWVAIACSMVLLLHLAAMYLAWQAAAWTGVRREQQIAVAISGSQKTLMVGLKLAIDAGASILPLVAYHVLQLLVDAMIAGKWKRAAPKLENAAFKTPPQD